MWRTLSLLPSDDALSDVFARRSWRVCECMDGIRCWGANNNGSHPIQPERWEVSLWWILTEDLLAVSWGKKDGDIKLNLRTGEDDWLEVPNCACGLRSVKLSMMIACLESSVSGRLAECHLTEYLGNIHRFLNWNTILFLNEILKLKTPRLLELHDPRP